MARTHYENPRNAEFKIDPARLLEKLGIDNYSVDDRSLTVTMPAREFLALAWHIDKKINDKATVFHAYGWKWVREG